MSRVDENIKYGMIEAISHLIHRDYEAIVEDFVTLEFIPPGTDLSPILPVLAKVRSGLSIVHICWCLLRRNSSTMFGIGGYVMRVWQLLL